VGVSDERPDLSDGGTGPESPDAAEVNLAPRTHTDVTAPRPRRRRRWGAAVVLAVVLTGGAIVLFQGLSNATVYFCNANEVDQRTDCTADKRFRLQGSVDAGSVEKSGDVLRFTVSYGGATVPVRYQGDPGGIFAENIPVVVEGRMGDDGTFAGDRILVKHSEQYREEHPDNVKDYDE
jgi:cytochrome c-type biogenesis protein CcmE